MEDWGVEIISHKFENGIGIIKFSGKIEKIPEKAFSYCSSLRRITLPNSVTSIGYQAFDECNGFTSVYFKPSTPPKGVQSMLTDNDWRLKIYVPSNSVDAYKSELSNWRYSIISYDF